VLVSTGVCPNSRTGGGSAEKEGSDFRGEEEQTGEFQLIREKGKKRRCRLAPDSPPWQEARGNSVSSLLTRWAEEGFYDLTVKRKTMVLLLRGGGRSH